jgi:hypothetical protein
MRVRAVRYATGRLYSCDYNLRVWPHSLTLGIALPKLLDISLMATKSQPWDQQLLEQTTVRWSGEEADEDDLEVCFDLKQDVPLIRERGMYFLCDIQETSLDSENLGEDADVEKRRNLTVLHVPAGQAMDIDFITSAYKQNSFAELKAQFHISSVATLPIGTGDSIPRHRGMTNIYLDVWETYPPLPLRFPAVQDIKLGPSITTWKKHDDNDNEEDEYSIPALKLLEKNCMDTILHHIFMQFVHDLINKCPPRRNGKPNCSMSLVERSNVPYTILFDTSVPFYAVHLIPVKLSFWEQIIHRLFPDQGYAPPATMHHFGQCSYFIAWTMVMNRLTRSQAMRTKDAVMNWLWGVDWLPYATKTALWGSGKGSKGYRTLPKDWNDNAVRLAVNPTKYNSGNLSTWDRRLPHSCTLCK